MQKQGQTERTVDRAHGMGAATASSVAIAEKKAQTPSHLSNATDDRIAIGNPMVSYYIGETARNSYTGSIEHQEAVKKLQANNALGKHALEYTMTGEK